MRERMRLEKEKKNGNKEKEDPKAQQKRKCPEGETNGQKKKKKTQNPTESAKEKEQKAKDREEKKKKKNEDQERQKFLLETRKAQAASRWAASNTTDDEVAIVNPIFTPEPIRQTTSSSSPSRQSSTSLTPDHTPLSSDRTPNTSTTTTPESIRSSAQETPPANVILPVRPNIPARPTGLETKGTCEPRRGLHFQSAAADSSDEESDQEVEVIPDETDVNSDLSSSDCCKEQRLETKALRKRLDKVHKRLNIACKFLLPLKITSVNSLLGGQLPH